MWRFIEIGQIPALTTSEIFHFFLKYITYVHKQIRRLLKLCYDDICSTPQMLAKVLSVSLYFNPVHIDSWYHVPTGLEWIVLLLMKRMEWSDLQIANHDLYHDLYHDLQIMMVCVILMVQGLLFLSVVHMSFNPYKVPMSKHLWLEQIRYEISSQ